MYFQTLNLHNFTTTQSIFKQNKMAWSPSCLDSKNVKMACSQIAWAPNLHHAVQYPTVSTTYLMQIKWFFFFLYLALAIIHCSLWTHQDFSNSGVLTDYYIKLVLSLRRIRRIRICFISQQFKITNNISCNGLMICNITRTSHIQPKLWHIWLSIYPFIKHYTIGILC